ncbi:hypothetical protein JN535_08780 [Cellulosimicrobium cellulans]|uniref:hypothetical protein n=1 Tax=Cellulosimicrobium cellulans TaxID=1710 RepID=UPI0019632584|nr:hypothetical protein [Cellulosimicrobium cellulans]MBN0040257.1 hypothetical protein [Cellulosimicrobium cellulans]
MDTGQIISLVAALGIGGILKQLIDNVAAWRKGRQAEERDAWAERDREAKARRVLEEYAHALRRLLFRLGLREGASDDDIPPFPNY